MQKIKPIERKPCQEQKRILLTCRACGYKWIPKPRKWRNLLNPIEFKMLKCPSCATVNFVREEDLGQIWKHNL